jgi:hypothetical protein
MQIVDSLSDKPIVDSLRPIVEAGDAWQPFAKHLVDLVSFLSTTTPHERLYCVLLQHDQPELVLSGSNDCSVKLWADYFEGSPRADEPLRLHIRMQIQRGGVKLTRDVRTHDFNEVAQQICVAFGFRES